MSRIYEAIQRADRERNAVQQLAMPHGAEVPIAPCMVEVPRLGPTSISKRLHSTLGNCLRLHFHHWPTSERASSSSEVSRAR